MRCRAPSRAETRFPVRAIVGSAVVAVFRMNEGSVHARKLSCGPATSHGPVQLPFGDLEQDIFDHRAAFPP